MYILTVKKMQNGLKQTQMAKRLLIYYSERSMKVDFGNAAPWLGLVFVVLVRGMIKCAKGFALLQLFSTKSCNGQYYRLQRTVQTL